MRRPTSSTLRVVASHGTVGARELHLELNMSNTPEEGWESLIQIEVESSVRPHSAQFLFFHTNRANHFVDREVGEPGPPPPYQRFISKAAHGRPRLNQMIEG